MYLSAINYAYDRNELSGTSEEAYLEASAGNRISRKGLQYNLQDIKTAAGWARPSDFNQYYDVKVVIPFPDQPIKVVYLTDGGTVLATEELGTFEIGSKQSVPVKTTVDGYSRKFMYYGSTTGFTEYPTTVSSANSNSNVKALNENKSSTTFSNVITYSNGGTTVVCVMEKAKDEVIQKWVDEDGNPIKTPESLGKFPVGTDVPAVYEETVTSGGTEYTIKESYYKRVQDGVEQSIMGKRTVSTSGSDAVRNREATVLDGGLNFYGVYTPAGPKPTPAPGKDKVTVTYKTTDGTVIGREDAGSFTTGTYVKATVDFPVKETINYNGNVYTIFSSYRIRNDTGKKTATKSIVDTAYQTVLRRESTVFKGGIEFVYIMQTTKGPNPTPIPDIPPNPDIESPTPPEGATSYDSYADDPIVRLPDITLDIQDPDAKATIQADKRDDEKFDVVTGIPTTDTVYIEVRTKEYLFGYRLAQKTGQKTSTITFIQPYAYNLVMVDKAGDESGGEQAEKPVGDPVATSTESRAVIAITRNYAYWDIERLEVYALDGSLIEQYCLPDGSVSLVPHDYSEPVCNYAYGGIESTPGGSQEITLPSIHLGDNPDAVPEMDLDGCMTQAKSLIKQYTVRNAKLEFQGEEYLDGGVYTREADRPTPVITSQSQIPTISRDTLYEKNLIVDAEKENGWHDSTGTVTYKSTVRLGSSKSNQLTYEVSVNKVLIHTPVVCDPVIEDDAKEWVQLISPPSGMAMFVLDKTFSIYYPTVGTHKDALGYRTRDYGGYTKARQVKFPFDVYANDTYVPANNWINLISDISYGYISTFYIPIWVEEGNYQIEFRTLSLNAKANDPEYTKVQALANTEYTNYVATKTINCNVSGRMYGLNIYDISDYSKWESVFRKPNSMQLTGTNYAVGTKDLDGRTTGRDEKYTFPLVNGSHPFYKNVGITGTGYYVRFRLTTLGSMDFDTSWISIKPTFYWVDKTGQTRQEVDVYYSETIDGKMTNLVKVGNSVDAANIHRVETGSVRLGIPEAELTATADIRGMTLNQIKAQKKRIYAFSDIRISPSLRTFVGTSDKTGVSDTEIKKSIQNWYCEYYLPSEVHVAPKGYDVYGYSKSNGGITYKETFWKKEGYLLVNFDIISYKEGGVPNLSYVNAANEAAGYLNQWKTEGFRYSKKDWKNNMFVFQDGDFVMFDLTKSARDDYTSIGTH